MPFAPGRFDARRESCPDIRGRYLFVYYSTNPATGNGTVLVATLPGGRIPAGTDREAASLTPATVILTIVEVAAGAEGPISPQLAAVNAANLTPTLSEPGPFTVFAPWNPAFEKLPPGTLNLLVQDPDGLLADVLAYHVAPGRYTTADLARTQSLRTVHGENVTVAVRGSSIEVEGAPILFPNVEAKNGVIHVIDEVMIPPLVTNNLRNLRGNR